MICAINVVPVGTYDIWMVAESMAMMERCLEHATPGAWLLSQR